MMNIINSILYILAKKKYQITMQVHIIKCWLNGWQNTALESFISDVAKCRQSQGLDLINLLKVNIKIAKNYKTTWKS